MNKIQLFWKKHQFVILSILGSIIIMICFFFVEFRTGLVRPDKTLKIDNGLFIFSFLSFIVGTILFFILIQRFQKNKQLISAILIGPIISFLVLSVTSIRAGTETSIANIGIPYQTNKQLPPKMIFPIIFDNGSSKLESEELKKILDFIPLFDNCISDSILVRGYASSRKFPDNSNNRNLLLANRRAEVVANMLRLETGKNFISYSWHSYSEMMGNRRVIDTTSNGILISKLELLNRRVEIMWDNQSCLDFVDKIEIEP